MKFNAFALSLCLAASSPALAHHAFSSTFDAARPIKLSGVLTRVELANPHSYFDVQVSEGGRTRTWSFEAAGPGALFRRGLKKSDLKVGSTVIVQGYRAKSDQQLVDARRLTLADGRVINLAPTETPGA